MKCCLCKKEIEKVGTWMEGNNAEPLASGRCCESCDIDKVIPARLEAFKNRDLKTAKKFAGKD